MAPSIAASNAEVVAFIDLGTYSVRLLIVRFNPNGSYSILSEQKELSRLGAGELFERRLEQQAMQRAATICSKFVRMAEGFGASEMIAVATAATRDARNQRQFLRLLKKEAGLEVRVISGEEEARLIYLGVSRGMHLDGRRALFIDIGGGSTEISVGDEKDYHLLSSLAIGSIRLAQAFGLNEPVQPIPPAQYDRACRHVRGVAVRVLEQVRRHEYTLCVGSSGTLINLAQIAAKSPKTRSADPAGLVLRYEDLRALTPRLCAKPLPERRKVPRINPDRADIILGGAAIIETLMQQLGIEQVRISQRGLRDGLLVHYLSLAGSTEHPQGRSTRHRGVLLLARRCGFDEPHAQHVVGLALQLFDQSHDLSLHPYGPHERELLEYAGVLHDIGMFLSFHNHHVHSEYLIRNAELVGFDQTEIAVIAATARYHHKGSPRKRDPDLAELDEPQRQMAYRLGVLLRLAETLDRSHAGVIRRVTLRRTDKKTDKKTIALELHVRGDCSLEWWAVQKLGKAFKKAFACDLTIHLDQEAAALGHP